LLKAGLVVTLLHESEHFNKRLVFEGAEIKKARTPKKSDLANCYGENKRPEGGIYFMESLFSNRMVTLNLAQAEYILNLANWKKFDDFNVFRKEFEKITFKEYKDIPSIRLKESDIIEGNDDATFCYIGERRFRLARKGYNIEI
jgi:hypothetical protein